MAREKQAAKTATRTPQPALKDVRTPQAARGAPLKGAAATTAAAADPSPATLGELGAAAAVPARLSEGQRAEEAAKHRPKGAAAEAAKAKAQDAPKRSGGPMANPDPTKPALNKLGEVPTHPPDLADGPPNSAARRTSEWPSGNIADVEDDDQVKERIRTAEKADILYFWKQQEKDADAPRAWVIDAINARLLDVQGPPLPTD